VVLDNLYRLSDFQTLLSLLFGFLEGCALSEILVRIEVKNGEVAHGLLLEPLHNLSEGSVLRLEVVGRGGHVVPVADQVPEAGFFLHDASQGHETQLDRDFRIEVFDHQEVFEFVADVDVHARVLATP